MRTVEGIVACRLEDLHGDGVPPQEQLGLAGSLVALPLSSGRAVFGGLVFESTRDRAWEPSLLGRLRIVGHLFAGALARQRADAALKEGEARARLAGAAGGVGLWEVELSTGRVWASVEARDLYGMSRDVPITVEDVLAAIHPDDWESTRARLQRVLRQEDPESAEYRVLLPDGTVRWINTRGRSSPARPGHSRDRIMGVSIDITAAKQAQADLVASHDRYRSIVECAHGWVWEVDAKGVYTYSSPQVLDVLGYAPSEVLGKRPFDFMPPEEAVRVEREFRAIADERRSFRVLENVNRHKDGRLVILETNAEAILDGEGQLIGYRGMDLDITERKKAIESANATTAWMATAIEAADLGVSETLGAHDHRATKVDARLRDILGAPPEMSDGIAKFWVAHLHPADREYAQEVNRRLDDGDIDDTHTEYRYNHPQRGTRWLDHVIRVVARDQAGLAARRVGVVRDITDLKEREERLRQALDELQRLRDELHKENVYLRTEVRALTGPDMVVGHSRAMRQALELITQVAPTSSTVLLLGETGTGKERFANTIHQLSPRRDRVMIRVNCAAIPATLIETELFGREKGAYTGALARQAGRFELANGSTIFLDEVGDLSPEVQVKLLRVLQERQVERLGSPRPISVDVRVIAATNRDLEREVREGRFRPDLYYRLNVFPIVAPPLRDRPDDIPALVQVFLQEFMATMGKRVESIDRASLEALTRHDWPGNVRELRNVVERAMIVNCSPTLKLPLPPRAGEMTAKSRPVVKPEASAVLEMKGVERDHILRVLESTGWRIRGAKGAAAILGLAPTTLEGRMARLGIRRPGKED